MAAHRTLQLYHREGAGGRGKGACKKNKSSGDGLFFLERVMGLTGGTGAVPQPARGTRKRYTVSFPPLAGTFPSSPIPQSSFQQKYPPIREDISVGAGNGTLRSFRCLVGLRPTRAGAPFAPRGGKRRHRRLFLSALRVPSISISTKISPHSGGYFCWSG